MTYTVTYHGESLNVDTDDKVFGILGTVISWVESNQATHTRIYQGIAHDGQNGGMRITFKVEDIPDDTAPSGVLATIDDLITNEINGPNSTDFPLASEDGAQVTS